MMLEEDLSTKLNSSNRGFLGANSSAVASYTSDVIWCSLGGALERLDWNLTQGGHKLYLGDPKPVFGETYKDRLLGHMVLYLTVDIQSRNFFESGQQVSKSTFE